MRSSSIRSSRPREAVWVSPLTFLNSSTPGSGGFSIPQSAAQCTAPVADFDAEGLRQGVGVWHITVSERSGRGGGGSQPLIGMLSSRTAPASCSWSKNFRGSIHKR
jgi:hypothetical protein